MKTIFIASLFAMLIFISCSNDDDGTVDCITATSNITTTGTAYGEDSSNDNCVSYRNALQVYINNDCAGENQDSFQAILDALPCN